MIKFYTYLNNSSKFAIIYLISLFSLFLNADSNLGKLILPENFEITIFAKDLNTPRQITETTYGHIIVGSKKGNEIIALLDIDKDGSYEEKVVVANNLQNPTGVAYKDGALFFAEIDTIWKIDDIDLWLNSDHKYLPKKSVYISDLPSETWHGFKYIDFGPDGHMYIPIGVPCNICIEPQTEDQDLLQYTDMKMAN